MIAAPTWDFPGGIFVPEGFDVIILAETSSNSGGQAQTLIFLALLFGAMYFLMIRPQQKRRKQFMDLIKSLEVGNEVETIAGIFGTIRRLDDDHAWVEVAEGTVLKMTRGAIRRTVTADQGSDASE